MKIFSVPLRITAYSRLDVLAKTADEARKKAEEKVSNDLFVQDAEGGLQPDTDGEHVVGELEVDDVQVTTDLGSIVENTDYPIEDHPDYEEPDAE